MCLYENGPAGHDGHDLVYDPLPWAAQDGLPSTSPRFDGLSPAADRQESSAIESDLEINDDEQEADDWQEKSPDDMLPRELIGQTDKLEWAQVILTKLWPHLNRATEKIVKNNVEPKLQDKLPQAMKQLHFTKVDLADTLQFEVAQNSEPPISNNRCNIMKIGPIRIWLAPCQRREEKRRGVEIHIGIDLKCDVDIELTLIGKLKASIQELEIRGNLVIRLEPLIEESPIVGGLVIYFLDPPRIHVKWGGLSALANYPVLSGAVRRVIDQLVADAIVLPNLLFVPIVVDDNIVDNAMLKDPKALGVMRVTLRSGSIRGTEWQLRTEPYFRIQLSAESWETSVQSGTTALRWSTDEYHDFLVYDREQQLCIHMYDHGRTRLVGHPHDRIGRAKPIMVGHLLRKGRGAKRQIKLYTSKAAIVNREPPCGEVTVQLDWFQITPSSQHEHECIVKVKVDSVYIPADCGVESAALCVRIGGREKTTPTVRRRPLKQGLVHQFDVDYVMRLPTRRELVDNSSLVFEIVDRKRKVVGEHKLDLAEVSKCVNCIKVWGVAGSPAARMMFEHKYAKKGTISAEVTVTIQGMSHMEHELACKEMKKGFRPTPQLASLRSMTGELVPAGPKSQALERAPTLAFGKRTSLEWLNKLFAELWPKLVSFIERKMVDQYGSVTQNLRKGVPAPLRSICFSKFNLGKQSPEFGPIKVNDTPEQPEWQGLGGTEIRVHVRLDPPDGDKTTDIEITVMGMKVGIRALRLKGELVVRLEPFLNEMPVVGGIVVCFLDPPKIKMDFSGLGRVVDNTIFLAERVRGVINSEINRFLVMPNVIGVSVGTEDQGVDRALLRQPRPLGVLQVTAVRARGIAPDCWRMFRKPLCNPYLRLALADDEFITSVCSRTCDPEWPDTNTYDFMVFDWRQKLGVTVCEGYTLRNGQHELGHARPLYVMDAVEKSQNEEFIQLYAPKPNTFDDDNEDEEPNCGEVLLRCQWLHLVSGSFGTSDMCNIRVKVDEVWTNFSLADSFMIVRARVGTMDWKQTRRVKHLPPPKFATGAKAEGPSSQKTEKCGRDDQIELEVQHIFNLMIRTEDIDLGTNLELELNDRRERPFGSYSIQLKEVKVTPQLRRCWGGKSGAAKLKMFGPNSEESDVDLDVTIQGLTSTD